MRRSCQINLLTKKSGSAKVLCGGRNRLKAYIEITGSVVVAHEADQLAASSLRFCQKPRP